MGIVAIDLETTGIDPAFDRIIEIGAFKPETEVFQSFVNPKRPLPERIIEITHITDDMLSGAPEEAEAIEACLKFLGEDTVLLGHNIGFDHSFLMAAGARSGFLMPEFMGIDTLRIARVLLAELPSKRLEALCEHFGLINENAHRAFDDAKAAYELYERLQGVREEQCSEEKLFESVLLHYEPKKQEPMTKKQRSFLNAILTYHKLEGQYETENLTKSEASKLIDKLLFAYGRVPYSH